MSLRATARGQVSNKSPLGAPGCEARAPAWKSLQGPGGWGWVGVEGREPVAALAVLAPARMLSALWRHLSSGGDSEFPSETWDGRRKCDDLWPCHQLTVCVFLS